MEATKPIQQPKAKPAAKNKPAKKNVTGIKNAFLVIIVCFVVAVCLFLFFFGNPSHFDLEGLEGELPKYTMWGVEGGAPTDIIGTIFKGGIIVPVLQTLFLTVSSPSAAPKARVTSPNS